MFDFFFSLKKLSFFPIPLPCFADHIPIDDGSGLSTRMTGNILHMPCDTEHREGSTGSSIGIRSSRYGSSGGNVGIGAPYW
jgi:hypothetical protein